MSIRFRARNDGHDGSKYDDEEKIMSKFKISKQSWDKIQNYSRYAWEEHGSEIGGFMIVQKRQDGNFEMSEPVILEQEITAGNTTITKEALGTYYNKTAMKHGTDNLHYCWWHSHHTMSAFWSGTDLKAIDQDKNDDWNCSLVVNLKGEYKFRVNTWNPIETFLDIPIEIEGVKQKKVPKQIINEVDKLCTKPVSIVTKQPTNTYASIWGGHNRTLQGTLFNDNKDQERVDLEAVYDNLLTDYLTDDDFDKFKKEVHDLNKRLKRNKSQLRVGQFDKQEMLDTVINLATADSYIYAVGTDWTVEDVVESASDMVDVNSYMMRGVKDGYSR